MFRLAIAATILMSGCAGSKSEGQQKPAEPAAAPAAGQPEAAADTGMTLDAANAVVAAFVASHGQPDADEPLLQPKSLDEVLEILGKDQLDLFAAGATYAAGQQGVRAGALHAQIELSWGDACMVLADLLRESAARARPQKRKLEARSASLTDEEKATLATLSATIEEEMNTAKALMTIAEDHFKTGSDLARKVIASNPDDYLGYRVAADFYRLQQDWAQFDAMVKKIEAANAKSIGLTFLRGVAAADREGDPKKAGELLRDALDRDPGFTRAQAQLVLWSDSVPTLFAEYQKLKALNPRHQIVLWAGEKIERAHAAWKTANP